MKSIISKIHKTLVFYGIDGKRFLKAIKHNKNEKTEAELEVLKKLKDAEWFNSDLAEFKRQQGSDKTFFFASICPILTDKNDEGGVMNGAYFFQDLYVARMIYLSNPQKHLDIGSRTDGFVAHVASYREIEIIDIREIKTKVTNVVFRQANLMELPLDLIDYCDSISSLHALEHFGLGRYGDPIDYFGYLKAINNITKILKVGGVFYFSVPIGPQRVEFNAHRVFSLKYLVDILTDKFQIKSFSYVDDKGDFFENVQLTADNIKSNCNCKHGCGIFTLIKK